MSIPQILPLAHGTLFMRCAASLFVQPSAPAWFSHGHDWR
ncbi:hypothetical protein AtDm6_1748 [Acetobacter tropicalis]|uniref:Uncharacterized protein n=1 Tax=Acetobacter tropicalis TaxID=104102 RepID=A0A095B305_9PROT|nr:hypothetical protein AtDm6_1748 [Acetobacter tropicalis]